MNDYQALCLARSLLDAEAERLPFGSPEQIKAREAALTLSVLADLAYDRVLGMFFRG